MRNRPYPYYDIAEVATLRDLIAYGESHGADQTIFYTGRQNDEPMSFIEAAEEIRAVGTYLQELGLQGSHIALLGENSTEWCLSYFAIANSGNVVVPLDKELSAEDLAELIEHCGCEAIFYSEKYREQIAWFQALEGDFPQMRYFSLAQFSDCLEQGRKLLEAGSTLFDRAPARARASCSRTATSRATWWRPASASPPATRRSSCR